MKRGYMKINKKLVGSALLLALLVPDIAYAAEVVMYDDSNIDEIFEEVERPKENTENGNNGNGSSNIEKPNPGENKDEETIVSEEEVDKIVEQLSPESQDILDESDIYPKVSVYEKVVDMSEYQNPKNIDYDKLANSIDGAILRTSIRQKDKSISKDKKIETHYAELNKRDIPMGFYHYSRAINEKEAIEEANYVLDIVRNKKVSLPIYIDIEDNDRQAKASKKEITAVADAFTKAIRRNGYVAGIYSYPWFANKYLTKEVRDENEFWIAEWKKDAPYPKYKDSHYDSWQYSSKGGVYGYKGDLDKNILYRDYPLIMTGVSSKGFVKVAEEVIAGKWGNGNIRRKRLEYAGYDYAVIQKEVNRLLKSRRI